MELLELALEGFAVGVSSRMTPVLHWKMRFQSENDRPKTRCVKCTPMCASARVAPSNIMYQWYGYRSTGTGVLTTKVLLLR